jgi:hypothetical protein
VSPRLRFILIGAVSGAALGSAAAWAYFQHRETGLFVTRKEKGQKLRVQASPIDLAKLGVAMVAVLRQVQEMAKPA